VIVVVERVRVRAGALQGGDGSVFRALYLVAERQLAEAADLPAIGADQLNQRVFTGDLRSDQGGSERGGNALCELLEPAPCRLEAGVDQGERLDALRVLLGGLALPDLQLAEAAGQLDLKLALAEHHLAGDLAVDDRVQGLVLVGEHQVHLAKALIEHSRCLGSSGDQR